MTKRTILFACIILSALTAMIFLNGCSSDAVKQNVLAQVFKGTIWEIKKEGSNVDVTGNLTYSDGTFSMDGINKKMTARLSITESLKRDAHFTSGGTWTYNEDTKEMSMKYTWYHYDNGKKTEYDGDTFKGTVSSDKGTYTLDSQKTDAKMTISR